MSTEQESAPEATPSTPAAAAEAAPADAPKLRRRPFGYRKGDVREALDRQSAELGAREAELAELRQDIAALWLAFAQHDRMIRRALGEPDAAAEQAAAAPASGGEGGSATERTAAAGAPAGSAAAATAEDDVAIGRQLSDLDDVLAAIELATQTLERTYVEEARRPAEAGGEASAPAAEKPADS
jgi:hypothetical protein